MAKSSSDDFSVVVLASDLGIDARPFLSPSDHRPEEHNWHDCPSYLADEDFSDLDALQFFRLEPAADKSGNRIFRIVGKYFPGIFHIPLKDDQILMQAALVQNASRRFRYTLDLKKEEQNKQIIANIRKHAQVIRAVYRLKVGAQENGAPELPALPDLPDIGPEQLASMTRDHDFTALHNYGGVNCFNAPLQPSKIVGVKRVVQEKLPEGVNDRGLLLRDSSFSMHYS